MRKRISFDLHRLGPVRGGGLTWGVAGPILILFVLGVLAGGVVGTFFTPAGAVGAYLPASALPASLPLALWSSARFFLLLLLAATSWLGVALAPAAALLRGYVLSCAVSALYAAWSWRGLLCALLAGGIPALFLVPCFILAACGAFEASRRLLERRFGPWSGGPPAARRPGLRVGVIVLFIVLEALYSYYLLPGLLADI